MNIPPVAYRAGVVPGQPGAPRQEPIRRGLHASLRSMAPEERNYVPFVKASQINSLLRRATCADDSGLNSELRIGDSSKGIWQLRDAAERMLSKRVNQIEMMERKYRPGVYSKRKADPS